MPVSNAGSAELTVIESCRQGIKWITGKGEVGKRRVNPPH